ncbi:MAG: SHOCT domain-containing protein [Clostridium sp.]|uniref:SHOCT domain-containing protein n=1 Tax=Clostridium sp. TaxID=1506 RepID=UPI0039EA23DA
MKVTKVTDEQQMPISVKKVYTQEELQREYDYIIAQKILKSILEKGLISVDEFNKITELNRQTFSPYLAEIML